MRQELFLFTAQNGTSIETDEVISGVGQNTTFMELGKKLDTTAFSSTVDRPDGWFLPKNAGEAAIVLETKSEKEDISKEKWQDELFKNIEIKKRYSKVVGILYNGKDIRTFIEKEEILDAAPKLQQFSYYVRLASEKAIDKNHIYEVTQRINNSLHFKFGMNDLQDRMIFTACALVAQRFEPQGGLRNLKDMPYNTFKQWIYDKINGAIENDKKQNEKLMILLEEYGAVRMAITENQEAINEFIDNVCEIADLVNSDYWNGEDVMAIFFNEFNRYRGKTDAGQVFTPDHITSFMYRLIDVHMGDRVLDATCGSGAFLVKSMCNMIREAGGVKTDEAVEIQGNKLFGIEMYRKVYALACANMMIHKDGKTNLIQEDAKTEKAGKWIKSKNITKVLMNPPYERKYKCMDIEKNVLDSVPVGTKCAFILPDKKLEKDATDKKYGNKLLKEHTLTTIVKLPENLFFGIGITTSIFIFETGRPQADKNIIGYYIENDGLETVKNKGRQDVRGRWQDIEDYWIQAIHDGNDEKYHTRQIINPKEHLSYQMP